MSSCLQAHQANQSMQHQSKRSDYKVTAAKVHKDFIGAESLSLLFINFVSYIYIYKYIDTFPSLPAERNFNAFNFESGP